MVKPLTIASGFSTLHQSKLILTCFVILFGFFGIIVDTSVAPRLLHPSKPPRS